MDKIAQDEDYRKWEEKKYRWVPAITQKMELKPFSLHFLFGPRQVGKTTAIKLLVKKLLDSGVKEESIFYFRCDEISDFRELGEVVRSYLDMRKRLGIWSSYILLDEVTFPREWYRSIKSMVDAGELKNDVVVLTGSASLLARREVETFPGRRGGGKDFTMLPLSFRDFIKVADAELHARLPSLENLEEGEIKGKTAACLPFLDELNDLLEKYMSCGGFPLGVEFFLTSGRVGQGVYDAYLAWLKNDVTKIGRSVEIAREIVKVLLTKMPSPVSWESISKEIEIKSPKTASAYVHLLNSLFVTLTLYHIDLSRGSINFGKNKKIHFIDPLFYPMFSRWCLVELKDPEPKIAEAIAASHLARFSSQGELGANVFYWRDGEEVDVVVRSNGLKGFEVKWAERAEGRRRMVGRMKQLTVLSRDAFQEKPIVTPLSAFLACMEF